MKNLSLKITSVICVFTQSGPIAAYQTMEIPLNKLPSICPTPSGQRDAGLKEILFKSS